LGAYLDTGWSEKIDCTANGGVIFWPMIPLQLKGPQNVLTEGSQCMIMFIFFFRRRPKHSPAKIVEVLESISSKVEFEEFPWLEKHLWAGKFWRMGIL